VPGILDPLERLKNSVQFLGRYPDAGVFDIELRDLNSNKRFEARFGLVWCNGSHSTGRLMRICRNRFSSA